MNHLDTGRHGERVAARFLKRNGCRILERNYRAGRHEIDLIAWEKATETVVFVEVKTRAEGGLGRPMDAVTRSKQHFLRLAAERWIAEHNAYDCGARFDVIEVLTPSNLVNHVQNAF